MDALHNARLSAFYKKIQELLVYRKEIQIVIFSNIYFVSNDRIRHKAPAPESDSLNAIILHS